MSKLVKCQTCGKRVSENAAFCPKCGETMESIQAAIAKKASQPRKFRFWRYFFLSQALIFVAVVSCSEPDTTTAKSHATTPKPTSHKAVVSTPAPPPAPSAIKPHGNIETCEVKAYKQWQNQCRRILTYKIIKPVWEDEYPTKLTLSFDGERIGLQGLVPLSEHRKYYTNTQPTLAKIKGVQYVANRTFFNENSKFRPIITVDDVKYDGFKWEHANHWVTTLEESQRMLEAFKKGNTAKVEYFYNGKGRTSSQFSLSGFTTAVRSLIGEGAIVAKATPSGTKEQAIKLVAQMIPESNAFDVSERDLQVRKNPKGEGFFVFIPERRYFKQGTKRTFLWFIRDSHVLKLNGPTHKLMPHLSYPRDADPEIWRDTGLDPMTIIQVALRLSEKG